MLRRIRSDIWPFEHQSEHASAQRDPAVSAHRQVAVDFVPNRSLCRRRATKRLGFLRRLAEHHQDLQRNTMVKRITLDLSSRIFFFNGYCLANLRFSLRLPIDVVVIRGRKSVHFDPDFYVLGSGSAEYGGADVDDTTPSASSRQVSSSSAAGVAIAIVVISILVIIAVVTLFVLKRRGKLTLAREGVE